MSIEAGGQQPCVKQLLTQQKLSPPIVDLLLEDPLPFLSHTSLMLDAKSTVFLTILKLWGQKLPSPKMTRGTTHNHWFFTIFSKSMINCICRAKLAAVTTSLTYS